MEAKSILLNLPVANKSGVLVNFIGHGNESGIGNKEDFFINWQELLNVFQTINANNNVILNSSLMCKGKGVFSLRNATPKPFYAAFGTNTSTDASTYHFTKSILEGCIKEDNIINLINEQNQILRDNGSD